MKLTGKVVLVTGANGGIGKALVKALLDKGVVKVYAAARNNATVAELVQQHAGRVVALRLTSLTSPVWRRQRRSAGTWTF